MTAAILAQTLVFIICLNVCMGHPKISLNSFLRERRLDRILGQPCSLPSTARQHTQQANSEESISRIYQCVSHKTSRNKTLPLQLWQKWQAAGAPLWTLLSDQCQRKAGLSVAATGFSMQGWNKEQLRLTYEIAVCKFIRHSVISFVNQPLQCSVQHGGG